MLSLMLRLILWRGGSQSSGYQFYTKPVISFSFNFLHLFCTNEQIHFFLYFVLTYMKNTVLKTLFGLCFFSLNQSILAKHSHISSQRTSFFSQPYRSPVWRYHSQCNAPTMDGHLDFSNIFQLQMISFMHLYLCTIGALSSGQILRSVIAGSKGKHLVLFCQVLPNNTYEELHQFASQVAGTRVMVSPQPHQQNML